MKYTTPLLIFLLMVAAGQVLAQDDKKNKKEEEAAGEQAVRSMIESKQFIFVAQSARPMKGRTVQLTGSGLSVSSNTVGSNLPYFGRVYSGAAYTTEESGISFTSTDFEYKSEERKKGGWNITIRPKDVRNRPTMSLTIKRNGYASLNVSSTDRQSISYNGYVQEMKGK